MSTQERVTRYTRGRRRKPMLNIDLNAAPPCESRSREGISTRARSRDEQAGQQGDAIPAPIDLDAYEDDVIISSPRAFAEAKNNSTRNHGRTIVIDLDSGIICKLSFNYMGHQNTQYPGHMIDLETDQQGHSHLHPEAGLFMGEVNFTPALY